MHKYIQPYSTNIYVGFEKNFIIEYMHCVYLQNFRMKKKQQNKEREFIELEGYIDCIIY